MQVTMNYEHIKKNWKNIFLVNLKEEKNKIFSEIVVKSISKHIKENKNITILVNKKWFSTWSICNQCWYIPKCKNCDISISYHLNPYWEQFWICNICKTHYENFSICPNCKSTETKWYWYWTQQIQKNIKEIFWKNSILIESEKVNSQSKIEKVRQDLKMSNIFIWTSLLTTPSIDIKSDLLIIMNADVGLNIPDFNSNWRNFQFIYEALQNYDCKNFIVQSYNPDHFSIRNACQMDISNFRQIELKNRQTFLYPPYTQMCVIMYKDEIESKMFNKVNTMYQELLFLKEKYWTKDLEIFSTPAMIYKMFWKYRYNIILKSTQLRNFMDIAYSKLKISSRGFKIDREPENII